MHAEHQTVTPMGRRHTSIDERYQGPVYSRAMAALVGTAVIIALVITAVWVIARVAL